jgi:hypothetical protein
MVATRRQAGCGWRSRAMQERVEPAKWCGARENRWGSSSSASPKVSKHEKKARPLRLDIIVPVMMSCALLWWIGRGMNWTTRLVVTAITLIVIIAVLWFERAGF